MAHEISFAEGVYEAFYANTPAWHELGQVVGDAISSEAAIRMAHLDWKVEQSPVYFYPEGSGGFEKAENTIANYRSDTKQILGIVSNQYKVVQNDKSFDFMDSLLETGKVKYESAGALKDGRIVWVLARIPGDMVIGEKDVSRKYMLLYNSHDGTKSVRVRPTNVRVVCWNTLQAAIGVKDNEVSIRHKGKIKDKLRDAQKVLGIVTKGFDELNEKFQHLASIHVDKEKVDEYIKSIEPDIETKDERKLKNLERRRNKIRSYFNSEAVTAKLMEEPITAWTALNAATAYNTHGRKGRKNPANSFESCLIGAGANWSANALNKAIEVFS